MQWILHLQRIIINGSKTILFLKTVSPQHICMGCDLLIWKRKKKKNIYIYKIPHNSAELRNNQLLTDLSNLFQPRPLLLPVKQVFYSEMTKWQWWQSRWQPRNQSSYCVTLLAVQRTSKNSGKQEKHAFTFIAFPTFNKAACMFFKV